MKRPVSVFVAYSDVPAARHALAHVKTLLRPSGGREEPVLEPMLWRFNQLNDPRWRNMALADAGRAATIVLTMSADDALCHGAETWLGELATQHRDHAITALVLIGNAEAWTISVQRSARQPRSAPGQQSRPEATVLTLAEKPEAAACAA